MQAVGWPGAFQQVFSSSPTASIVQGIRSVVSAIKPGPSYSVYVAPPDHSINPRTGPAGDVLSATALSSIHKQMTLSNSAWRPATQSATAQSIIYPFVPRSFVPKRTFLSSYLRSTPYQTFRSGLGYPNLSQSRGISLFQTPSRPGFPNVAKLAVLEHDANQHPTDITKQVTLMRALAEMGGDAGLKHLISKWERMCEFDPASPLLRSDEAFETYLKALIMTKQVASVTPAVARREALLAANPILPESTTSNGGGVEEVPLSRSQQIANSVLADPGLKIASTVKIASTKDSLRSVFQSSASGEKANPVHVIVEESKGFMLWRAARFVGLSLLYGFIALTILSLLLENSGLLKAGPQQKEWDASTGQTVKFSDVHGVDEAKHDLQEIVEFLKDPTKFSTLGGKLPKGVLLTGPPGTGKTMLAKAVAGEAGVPFLFASGSEFDEIFVGTGAKRVRELFAAARKKQPSIVFIDELDAIGSKRSARDQHYMKQTLNQLLVELDGFKESEGVIVIAATNFPQSLDQALVRPGRFDKKIVVPLPDIRGRSQILEHHMKEVLSDITIDPVVLARGTPGFSGADLKNLVNQAAIQASREGASAVQLSHFEWAKDKILMGAERKMAAISDKEKLMTAYHEGGHALAALYTEGAMPLHKVTCVPRGHSLGMTTQLPENDRTSQTLTEFLATIDVCMGGRVAEELIYGKKSVTSGASSDIQKATQVARSMVKYYGYSDKLGPVFMADDEVSPQVRGQVDEEVRKLVNEGVTRVSALLADKKDELDKLAHALVEYETLNGEEVKKVIKGEKIRSVMEPMEEVDMSKEGGVRLD